MVFCLALDPAMSAAAEPGVSPVSRAGDCNSALLQDSDERHRRQREPPFKFSENRNQRIQRLDLKQNQSLSASIVCH